jgi:DNA helicase-2/ATP-dependent DNA helicase PcrA
MIGNSALFVPSTEQIAIFDWAKSGTGNLVVEALAGTGKTTTMLKMLEHSTSRSILFTAFNKRIADELVAKLKRMGITHATAKTLHGVGNSIVRRYWERIRMSEGSERAIHLTDNVVPGRTPDGIRKLITKLHTKGREIAPHATVAGDLLALMEQFDCIPDEQWLDAGFDVRFVENAALQAMELAANTKPVETGIDFADMIYLPVRNRWASRQYDKVVVDEAQDMTTAQLELALGVCHKPEQGGRVCIVGDKHQAIYAFRGADVGSLDRLREELAASVLPLNTTYRCGHAIVAEAQRLVPAYTAGPNNPAGEVRTLPSKDLLNELQPGDFVLSRINAPLVQVAMSLLKMGKRVRIAGKDVGKNILMLAERLAGATMDEFNQNVDGWREREQGKALARFDKVVRETQPSAARRSTLEDQLEQRLDGIADTASILLNVAGGCTNMMEMRNRITTLFTDDGLGDSTVITVSTVHRAKGLEADRVYVLKGTLRDTSDEEKNIEYVAITRAKHVLTWVV